MCFIRLPAAGSGVRTRLGKFDTDETLFAAAENDVDAKNVSRGIGGLGDEEEGWADVYVLSLTSKCSVAADIVQVCVRCNRGVPELPPDPDQKLGALSQYVRLERA